VLFSFSFFLFFASETEEGSSRGFRQFCFFPARYLLFFFFPNLFSSLSPDFPAKKRLPENGLRGPQNGTAVRRGLSKALGRISDYSGGKKVSFHPSLAGETGRPEGFLRDRKGAAKVWRKVLGRGTGAWRRRGSGFLFFFPTLPLRARPGGGKNPFLSDRPLLAGRESWNLNRRGDGAFFPCRLFFSGRLADA